MNTQPELSRRIQVRSLGAVRPEAPGRDARHEHLVEATAAECRALALRLAVPSVASVSCRFLLSGAGSSGQVDADGLLQAELTRICVATLDEFAERVTERFSLRFVAAEPGRELPDDALDLEADDDVPYANGMIDLGEAAVEQLALALDPYPRKPGAELPADIVRGDPPAGVDAPEAWPDATTDDRPHPFAALARLRPTDD